jgi:hypothetical protein
MKSCAHYVNDDPAQGPCPHHPAYLEWSDDLQQELDVCACHYGDPHDPGECRSREPENE